MENICEWDNCKESGKFKAPVEKDNSKNHKWLCENHIKFFNKNWNYFEGMSQHEIENFLKSDLTWHRPTQEFGSSDNFFNILWNNALSDKFNLFRDEKTFYSSNNDSINQKVKILKNALNQCVDNENYESAAFLRDRINGLKSK